jgi:hypothetical protein
MGRPVSLPFTQTARLLKLWPLPRDRPRLKLAHGVLLDRHSPSKVVSLWPRASRLFDMAHVFFVPGLRHFDAPQDTFSSTPRWIVIPRWIPRLDSGGGDFFHVVKMEREALLNFVRQHKIRYGEQADQPVYGCVLFGFYGARENPAGPSRIAISLTGRCARQPKEWAG